MGFITYNLVNGEKYGDVNDPKTRWTTHGVLMINNEKADQADIDAFKRLIDSRAISLKLESMPLSRNWQGFLSIFERTSRDDAASGSAAQQTANNPPAETDDKPIDLSEIPF